ncbi:protein THEMIS2 isoform X2 [Sceloporus undulatus]|uniref:protein THEMIS2 isoform X2 n=1 Tax=Sceloporus undulatus TaxID=8520 RepID=UPI001C4ACDF8|nr:protein THEMIS2 isoform X2 [Sceloporus undulatus]
MLQLSISQAPSVTRVMDSVVSFQRYICNLDLNSLPRVVKIYSGVYFQGSVYELSGSECCLSTGDLMKIVDIQLQHVNCKSVEHGHTFELPLSFKGLFQPSQAPNKKKSFSSKLSFSKAKTSDNHHQQLYTLQEVLQSAAIRWSRLKCAEIGSGEFELYPVYEVEAIMHFRNNVVKISSMLDVEVIDITEESQQIHFIKPLMLSEVLMTDKVLPVEAEILATPECPPVFQSDWISNLYKGSRIYIHNQVSSWKILATAWKSKAHAGRFLISSTYKGRFRRCPRKFSSTSELALALATSEKLQVVVTKDYESNDDDFPLFCIGDRLELHSLARASSSSVMDTLVCYRDNGDEDREQIQVPLFLEAGFVENVRDSRKYTLPEAIEHLHLPCQVKVVASENALDPLSSFSVLTLEAQIKEPFLTVSLANKPDLTFEIPPKWLDISLFFTGGPVKPMTPNSTSNVEELTETFYYELLKQLPSNEPPPRPPKRKESTLDKCSQNSTEGKKIEETSEFSICQDSAKHPFCKPKQISIDHLPRTNSNQYITEYKPQRSQKPAKPCEQVTDDSDHVYEDVNEEVKGIVHQMGATAIKH